MNDYLKTGLAGLYIHIPFCLAKCPYCDFYSCTDFSQVDSFVDALILEMRMRGRTDMVFDSVYVGGGTPTILHETAIDRIMEAVFSAFVIEKGAEITIEANPKTVSPQSLSAFHQAGFNRINIGVQSFSDTNLTFLGRVHSAGDGRKALEMAESAGFDNIGLDLIYALPGQAQEDWQSDLAEAAGFSPEHISCYMLTYEAGTEMDRRRRAGRFRPLPDAQQANFFMITHRFLTDSGYDHYEISNFAASTDMRSRHNSKYWNDAPYMGFGPAAHSHDTNQRSWNTASVADYIRLIEGGKLPVHSSETLNLQQQMIESIYLGLRRADGIDFSHFNKRFGIDLKVMVMDLIKSFAKEGRMEIDEKACRLTPEGMLVHEGIADALIERI